MIYFVKFYRVEIKKKYPSNSVQKGLLLKMCFFIFEFLFTNLRSFQTSDDQIHEHSNITPENDFRSALTDNPSIILMKEESEKFIEALRGFQDMFPNADSEKIKEILRKHDGNSEKTLDELLTTLAL